MGDNPETQTNTQSGCRGDRPVARTEIHNRHSFRLKGWNYSDAGAYFVTVCAQDRKCLFGDGSTEASLNDFGEIVSAEWLRSAEIRSEIDLGEFVVMPNHLHGIIFITRTRDIRGCTGDRPVAPTSGPRPQSIGALIAGFKSAVTKRINEVRRTPGVTVWQRNYYEHIIRNEDDYARIAEYIINNPRRWATDTLHPNNKTPKVIGGSPECEHTPSVGATGRSPECNGQSPTSDRIPGPWATSRSPLRNTGTTPK